MTLALSPSVPVPPPPAAYPWSDQLADVLSAAINEAKVLTLLIRRGDDGLGRRLQLEAAERRVRMLSGQVAEARS